MTPSGPAIRRRFLEFFGKRGHEIVPSDSLVPSSDPTLLFTSAGMVQFKAHFLQQIPLTFRRAASSQRCLRTTDIDQVGRTPRHLTMFEMLGNFSFGDYFKEEAIAWGWEFLTKDLGLPADRLWPTIYKDDDEAFAIWKKIVGESRVTRLGEDTNFWNMGPTGPCGPCSEIYWDFEGKDDGGRPDDSDRWMEVWNLVFTQFDRQPDNSLEPLPTKNIDTGMGLERLTSVAEGTRGNFDTSLLRPLIQFGENAFKHRYGSDPKKDVSLRILADHLRAVTLLVFDGILPSNEGRGYVLRRLLRRAVRQGALFGVRRPFLSEGVPLVVDLMKDTAADLPARAANIANFIRQEEERFLETIETGSAKLGELVEKARTGKSKIVPGEEVFRLYDTYGFPPELTGEMLAESGLSFNQKDFDAARDAAQDLARTGWKGSGAKDVTVYNEVLKKTGPSRFVGYDTLTQAGPINALLKDGRPVDALNAGDDGEVVTSATPFYPEGGGQVGDKGFLRDKGETLATVLDTQKPAGDLIVHRVHAKRQLKIGQTVEFAVDPNHREPTKRHHTATHLLHAALRKVLGTTVTQAGSLVAPDRLRFDYTFNRPPTPDELRTVEHMVNDVVLQNLKSEPKVFPADEARKMGAMALFGEKYGDQVRCLIISPKGFADDPKAAFSLELCGGTHCSASGDIGAFKIVSDASIAAGVRRIEAVAGHVALEYFRGVESSVKSIAEKLRVPANDVETRVAKILDRQKQLEDEVRALKLKLAQGGGAAEAAPEIQTVNGVNLAVKVSDGLDVKSLRELADQMKNKIKSGVVFAASTVNVEGKDKVSFIVALTPDAQKKGLNAGAIAKAVAARIGGSGGGRPDFAQGGGQGKDKLAAALNALPSLIK